MATLKPSELIPVYEYMQELLQSRLTRYAKARHGSVADHVHDISFGKEMISAEAQYTYHQGNTDFWSIKMPIELLDESENDFDHSLKIAEAEYAEEQKLKDKERRQKDLEQKEREFEYLRKQLGK